MERLVKEYPRLPAQFRARVHSQAGSIFQGTGQIHHAEAAYLHAQGLAAEDAVRSGAIELVASYAVERLPQVPATRAA